jgi:hypothetical protein
VHSWTYVGGAVPDRRGRGALGKAIVAMAVERLGVGEKSKRVALRSHPSTG